MRNMSKVVRQLSKERERLAGELHKVTAALTAFGKSYFDGAKPSRGKRMLSVSPRRRISLAQKARWAKQNQMQEPKRVTSTASKRSLAQKARWAKVRAKAKKVA